MERPGGAQVGTVEYDPNSADGESMGGALETATPHRPEEKAEAPAVKTAPSAMYTMLAREGVNAAQLINTALAKRTIGKTTPRRIEVAPPVGQSTSGGKKARQSITLIATSGDAASVMCGWIDAAQKTAEVREYPTLAEQYQARFGTRFEASAEEYDALMKDLAQMLRTLHFHVTREEFEDSEPPPASPAIPWKSVAWVVGAAVVGGVIALFLS